MSDRYRIRIHLGGPIPDDHALVSELQWIAGDNEVETFRDIGPYYEMDDSQLCHTEDLRCICHRLGISYNIENDAGYEIPSMVTYWRPGMKEERDALLDLDGSIVVEAREIKKVIRLLSERKRWEEGSGRFGPVDRRKIRMENALGDAIERLKDFVTIPKLPALRKETACAV
jgi:hypothetical protein